MGTAAAAVISGGFVRRERGTLRLSQSELARQSKVSRYKVNGFERGDFEISNREKGQIAMALDRNRKRLVDALNGGAAKAAK